jgi:ABC-type branched-subunit amino acid transport system substrate-binding protein
MPGSGCGTSAPLSIGDAYPREGAALSFSSTLEPLIDSVAGEPVRLERWTVPANNPLLSATEQALRFANLPGLVAVVGHAGSRDALLAASVYEQRGVPNVVPAATSRRLSSVGEWILPLAPNDSVEGAFLASFAADSLGARRVVVLYVGDEYGAGIRDGVEAAIGPRDMQVDDVLVAHSVCGSNDLAEAQELIVTAAMRRSMPEVVILAVGADATCLSRFVLAERPGTWILGADGATFDSAFLEALTAAQEARIRRVAFWVPGSDPANTRFIETIMRTMGREPTSSEALTWDAYAAVATAIREGGPTRVAVRNWFESLGRSRPPFEGVSGPISFENGLRVGGRLFMVPAEVLP